MVEIKITSDSDLKRNYDGKWRESHDAKRLLVSKAGDNCTSSVPDCAVDAIAAAMDNANESDQPKGMPILGDVSDIPAQNFMPSKEQAIAVMMQNYVKQNGGIVVQDNQENVKTNKTLFG